MGDDIATARNRNPPVNRYLENKAMDHIDHALGRPVFPLRATKRNYFATSANGPLALEFAASPHWEQSTTLGDMAYFHVTDEGRQALASHLATLGNQVQAYEVTFEGCTTIVPARSRSGAKYKRYLDVSDAWSELTFRDFCRGASVRKAA